MSKKTELAKQEHLEMNIAKNKEAKKSYINDLKSARKEQENKTAELRAKIFSPNTVWLGPALAVTEDNKIYQLDLKFGQYKDQSRFWEVKSEDYYSVFRELVRTQELAKAMASK